MTIVATGSVTKGALQDAIDAAVDQGGGVVRIPRGIHDIDGAVNISGPVTLEGVVAGPAHGGPSGGTVLRNTSAADHLFNITADASVTLRDFGITASVTKNAGTAAIYIDEGGTGGQRNKKIIERLKIEGFYNAIEIVDCIDFHIENNLITSFTNYGIRVAQVDANDHGAGIISGNKLWDVSGTAGASAGIIWQSGSGLRIVNNRLLGSFDYGIRLLFDKGFGDDGSLIISGNLIERQNLYAIHVMRTGDALTNNRKIGKLIIIGNNIQAIDVGYQNVIAFVGSSPGGWIEGGVIANNIVQHGIAAPASDAVFLFNDGVDLLVHGNVIQHVGSGDGGIRTGGFSSNVQVINNLISGGTTAKKYPALGGVTLLKDNSGLAFADLKNVANGSQVYVSDGTPGTPLTGGGTGSLGVRLNGAWKGL